MRPYGLGIAIYWKRVITGDGACQIVNPVAAAALD
jgi:hypothetical protein